MTLEGEEEHPIQHGLGKNTAHTGGTVLLVRRRSRRETHVMVRWLMVRRVMVSDLQFAASEQEASFVAGAELEQELEWAQVLAESPWSKVQKRDR